MSQTPALSLKPHADKNLQCGTSSVWHMHMSIMAWYELKAEACMRYGRDAKMEEIFHSKQRGVAASQSPRIAGGCARTV